MEYNRNDLKINFDKTEYLATLKIGQRNKENKKFQYLDFTITT